MATVSPEISRPAADLRTDHYFVEAKRPAICFVFVIPILILYELGAAISGGMEHRNGIDLWIRRMLDLVGAGEILVLPLATAGILLCLHHRRRERWRVRPLDLFRMFLESLALGFILFCAAYAHHLLLSGGHGGWPSAFAGGGGRGMHWVGIVAFLGAGLYEELLFRLILLQGLVSGLTHLRIHGPAAIGLAIATVSILFAVLHFDFVNPAGHSWQPARFVVYMLASVFFCLVFLLRGFGIAVGTHVIYDLLTQL